MPDNNQKDQARTQRFVKSADKQIDLLNDRLNNVYQDLYSTDIQDKEQLDRLNSDIAQSINSILSTNSDIKGIPDIAQLYSRIQKRNNTTGSANQIVSGLMDIMSNEALMNTLIADPEINRYILMKDLQTDMILKYMPKLKEALNIKKDNVLSADNFNKTFLNPINDSLINEDDQKEFAKNAKALIKKYDLETKFEKIYDDTAKYGEEFIYIVPYKKALERLHQYGRTGDGGTAFSTSSLFESTTLLSEGKVPVSDIEGKQILNGNKDLASALDSVNCSVNLTFNTSGVLEDVVDDYKRAEAIINKTSGKSLYEAFVESVDRSQGSLAEGEEAIKYMSDTGAPVTNNGIRTNTIRPAERVSMDKIAPDDLEYDKLYQHANDGLIYNDEMIDPNKLKEIPGCVFRILKHENVIPIYIDNICLGYYYIEFKFSNPNEDLDRSKLILNNTFDTIRKQDMKDDHDIVLRYIARKISANIDTKFINANQDLKEEIYTILKYNQTFNMDFSTNDVIITYLSPQDVVHHYFELDEDLHRGISDLEDSLIPALFWVLLELSTTMGIATRSQDHRVYYVRQNVETNIAKTLMNVVNQLKKGNMGIRQVQSINSILGIIGKYNDYVIPVGPSGDAPVSFDTIQGQQIDTPKELMDKYEENAVNATDVPLELVNSTNQADYATRYVMQNSKFLRKILKRQAIEERNMSDMFQRVYNLEYGTNYKSIRIQLPPPLFLSSVNSLALINNVNEYAKACVEIEFPEGTEFDEKEKATVLNLFVRQLLSAYVDISNLDRLREQVAIEAEAQKNPEQEDTSGGEEPGGEGEEDLGTL